MSNNEVIGFIINLIHKIEDNKSYVYVYGRIKTGESFCIKKRFRPYFFIKKKDVERSRKLIKAYFESTDFKNFNEDDVEKVIFDEHKILNDSYKLLEENNIDTFEADLKIEQRFLMDHDLLGSLKIKGQAKKSDMNVDLFFDEPEVESFDWTPDFDDLKILSFDIETDMTAKKLYSVSVYTNKDEKGIVFIIDKKNLKNAISCASERELLERFIKTIIEFDPDIITGWNLIDFDLKILDDKIRSNKLSFSVSRNKEELKLKLTDSFMTDSKAECEGRVILDGIHLLKTSFIKLDDYKLGTAAREFTDSEKLIGDANKGEEIEDAYNSNPQKLVDYNLLDSKLVMDILRNSGALKLTVLRTRLTGMSLDRVRASIASFDSLYIRNLHKRKVVGPTNKFVGRDVRTTGGFVMNSVPGIYNFVIVCDFKSLYPSIMRTFNIDPLMFRAGCRGDNLIRAPNGACFKREPGVLPSLLESLWQEREKARKNNDALTRQAIKISMNSMYGVLASPNCRFYSVDMANAITHFGHMLLKKTKEIVEAKGYKVLYGDTDSVFVSVKADNVKDAENIGEELELFINNFFDKYLYENFGVKSKIELEFEKTFKRFFLPRARSSEEGAKKRYAGLLVTKDGEKIDFTGLEFVRRDWTDVSKKFQLELLEMIFDDKPVDKFIRDFVENLKKGKYDDLLVYRKALRKDIKEYTKTTPPHVKAARLLDKITTNIIDYVITKNGPEPVENNKSDIDYEHYIDKQIKPLADAVLYFFDTNFNEVIAQSQQKNLSDW